MYADAAEVNSDLAMVIKRLLDNGDIDQAEAELVWRDCYRVSNRCLH